jgi:hypothetical protein
MEQFEHVACTVCGCVCDDLRMTVEEGRISKCEGACRLAEPWFLIGQRTLVLWWDTGTHAAREESERLEVAAAGLVVGAACLGAGSDRANPVEVTLPLIGVKGQRRDQGVGGIADLAQRAQWGFPPAAARSGGPGRDDSPC